MPARIHRAVFLALSLAFFPLPAAAAILPSGFTEEDAAPGAGFIVPVGIAFLPDGRMLVAEKRGLVWAVKNGVKHPMPMWDGETEVLDSGDRGLLGIAVDPDYASNRYIYMLYTVDPDSDGIDTDDDAFGRLTRYQVSAGDSNMVDDSTRSILMGVDWSHGPLSASSSHTIGSLRWGSDGSLLVSVGDGAQFNNTDAGGNDPGAFGAGKSDPYEDIGAFRAQYLGCLPGKILRLDPATGQGLPSNPYWNGDPDAPQSKIWAYGLRNAFRFTVKPGTGSTDPSAGNPGTLYVGEVGWTTWEEIDIVKMPGANFGWPCYEGIGPLFAYQGASPSHGGCDSIGTAWNPADVTAPTAAWNHYDPALSTPPGFRGNSATGGAFYTGSFYPAAFHNRYFFGDFGQSWIKILVADSTDNLIDVQPFAEEADGPVDFVADPVSGDLFYVAIFSFKVRRIRWLGGVSGNTPPVANANGSPLLGVPPLAVSFSSAGTYDFDGDSLTTVWLFGDGQGSTDPDPMHTYTLAGTYVAVLTADDGQGGIGRDSVTVRVSQPLGFPSTGILDDFDRPAGPLGGDWADEVGAAISDSALVLTAITASPVWNGAVFDSVQEAYFTLDAVTASFSEHDLMLKVQGLSWTDGHIEVRYNATLSNVWVSTYTPGIGWESHGTIAPVTLQAGSRFGARAHADGRVEVFQDGVLLGEASVAGWPFAASGGRIGLTIADANETILDDFGGGNAVVTANTEPTAIIGAPADTSFYVSGDTLVFLGTGTDAQDPADSLAYHWSVRLHHNTHVHPELEADGDSASLVMMDDDDGTAIRVEARLYVTDQGGLADTAVVNLFPEADLEPSPVTVTPAVPVTTGPAQYRFRIRNGGRLPAHISRWRLVANATTLAEGDTVVAALDSVTVTRLLPPILAAGDYDLRVVVDTLGTLVETDETNNTRTRPLTVFDGPTDVPLTHGRFSLSSAFPSPSPGATSLVLELPRASRLEFAIYDLDGREVYREPERAAPAGRWTLRWPGLTRGGERARPGVYLARVVVDGTSLVRRFAVVR